MNRWAESSVGVVYENERMWRKYETLELILHYGIFFINIHVYHLACSQTGRTGRQRWKTTKESNDIHTANGKYKWKIVKRCIYVKK